jgi:hypothetical protein
MHSAGSVLVPQLLCNLLTQQSAHLLVSLAVAPTNTKLLLWCSVLRSGYNGYKRALPTEQPLFGKVTTQLLASALVYMLPSAAPAHGTPCERTA